MCGLLCVIVSSARHFAAHVTLRNAHADRSFQAPGFAVSNFSEPQGTARVVERSDV
jgi:hypothetical protein